MFVCGFICKFFSSSICLSVCKFVRYIFKWLVRLCIGLFSQWLVCPVIQFVDWSITFICSFLLLLITLLFYWSTRVWSVIWFTDLRIDLCIRSLDGWFIKQTTQSVVRGFAHHSLFCPKPATTGLVVCPFDESVLLPSSLARLLNACPYVFMFG